MADGDRAGRGLVQDKVFEQLENIFSMIFAI
jgi:hypothetical protein